MQVRKMPLPFYPNNVETNDDMLFVSQLWPYMYTCIISISGTVTLINGMLH